MIVQGEELRGREAIEDRLRQMAAQDVSRFNMAVPYVVRRRFCEEEKSNPVRGQDLSSQASDSSSDLLKVADESGSKDVQEALDNVTAMPSEEAFKELVARAQTGSLAARTLLREVLDRFPIIWKVSGDLAAASEHAFLSQIAPSEPAKRELLKRHWDGLKQELLGPVTTPLERMAVERVVQTWAQVQHLDMTCLDTNMDVRRAAFWSKQRDAAHRRWVSATKMLVAIRALLPASNGPSKLSGKVEKGATQLRRRKPCRQRN